jgi:glycosyltransferase involved in cell wall biosynthesis
MNRQHLLSRLAKRHAIVYSTGVWNTWDMRKPAFHASPLTGRMERCDDVLIDHRARLLVRLRQIPALDEIACQLACRRWRAALQEATGPLVAHIFNPEFLPFVEPLRADYLVYHAYDLFRFMGAESKAIAVAENQLLRNADLVIATSRETAKDFAARIDRPVHLLGNGVDWAQFDVSSKAGSGVPSSIPRPRIGYVGAINQKVDFALLLRLAKRRTDWNFVLVGAVGSVMDGDAQLIEQLRHRANVYLEGGVEQGRVKPILMDLDVGLVCYRKLEWTMAGYPLKLLEYLAAGLPVVATDLPAVVEFASEVAIARDDLEWEAHIEAALAGRGVGSVESRKAVARQNSWDHRAAALEILLQKMVEDCPRAVT